MILIATDYSLHALHATRVGIHLAQHTDSRVMLLHTFKSPSRAGRFINMDLYIRKAAEEDMDEFIGRIEERYIPYIDETRILPGYTEEVIRHLEARLPVGLVVLGTQGDSAIREIFMGRTATSLLNKLSCPMLAVPPEAEIAAPTALIFAWDGHPLDPHVCQTLTEWSAKIRCPLQLVHLHAPHKPDPDPETARIFAAEQIAITALPVPGDLKAGLDTYLAGHPRAWLAMIKRKRGLFEPLFHESMVKRQLFTTTAPLLIL